MPDDGSPNALELYKKTPRHFLADVDKFVRVTFGDGQLAAIRTAFKVVLGPAPAAARVQSSVSLTASATVDLDQPIDQVTQMLRSMVSEALRPLDVAACGLAAEQWAGTDWQTALEAGRSLLSPPVTWIVPSELHDDLEGVSRRNVVKLPGRGVQPTGRLVGDDYYVLGDLPEVTCVYGFRHGGGSVSYPKPLHVSVEVSGTELMAFLERAAVVSMSDPLAARKIFCASG